MRRPTVAAITVATLLLAMSPSSLRAVTPDLTITVPVNVTKLHKQVDTLWLTCVLYDASNAPIALGSGASVPMAPDAQGNYNGPLNSTWVFAKLSDFANAKKYHCKLQVRGGPGTPLRDLEDGDGSQFYHLKRYSARRLTADGTIP